MYRFLFHFLAFLPCFTFACEYIFFENHQLSPSATLKTAVIEAYPIDHRLLLEPAQVTLLASRVKKEDADVVCIQKIFERSNALELIEHLPSLYSHFYIEIGKLAISLDKRKKTLSSGLFIASRYPLNNPSFHSLKVDQSTIHFGVFEATLSIPKGTKQLYFSATQSPQTVTYSLGR